MLVLKVYSNYKL